MRKLQSSKVDDFGTSRKRAYDFLLVGRSDYSPILHRFRDIVTYLAKNEDRMIVAGVVLA